MPPPLPTRPPPVPGASTNLGTTVPYARPFTERATGTLPVARRVEDEGVGAKAIAPDPLWISRWQSTATKPPAKGPWVVAYRFWHADVAYESRPPSPTFRYDVWFKDGHKQAYEVPRDVYEQAKHLTTSVGQFVHKVLLVSNWRPGAGSRFNSYPIA